MTTLAGLRHELHETEQKLLTRLRSSRRDLRRTQGFAGEGEPQLAPPELTLGQRVADIVASSMGSWSFIIIQSVFLAIWIVLNITAYVEQWDPYPFILLNLFLSMLAAIQAPIIMMSQNRQDAKDRVRSELDYEVNRRAAADIQGLACKVNLLGEQISDLEDLIRDGQSRGEGAGAHA